MQGIRCGKCGKVTWEIPQEYTSTETVIPRCKCRTTVTVKIKNK
jgi:phage FluMu protein Com